VTGLPPPTNYYGGMARLAHWIASLLPAHRTYVEPFAGSAAVLFAKAPSPTEILNDLDGQVVNFFRVLRERPAELVRALALTPYARAEYQQLAAGFEDPGLYELERARRWFVRVNQSISHLAGRGRPSGWAAAYNTNGADHAHKFAALTNRLQACAERLRRVHLECRPAVEVIAKHAKPGAAAVVYCDPLAAAWCAPAGVQLLVQRAGIAGEEHGGGGGVQDLGEGAVLGLGGVLDRVVQPRPLGGRAAGGGQVGRLERLGWARRRGH
jgi:site-specific DNA-adenine methylase